MPPELAISIVYNITCGMIALIQDSLQAAIGFRVSSSKSLYSM